jgi:hypothetical protein
MTSSNEFENKKFNISNNEELKKVSTDFVLEMADRINIGYAARDVTINKMSESIDGLSDAINNSINSLNVKPTREDLQNDISSLKLSLNGENGTITKLEDALIGKDGTLTKIYNYIKVFLLILSLTGGIAIVILEVMKYFTPGKG